MKIATKRILLLLFPVLALTMTVQAAPPSISNFSPLGGPVGTIVTVNGSDLSNLTSFTIGGVAAIVVSNDGSTLVGMVMPGAATGSISVSTTEGAINAGNNFYVSATTYPSVQEGGKLIGNDVAGAASQGYSVAISADGSTAIVGGSGDNTNTGAAWIYVHNNGFWQQQGGKLVGSNAAGAAKQGSAVAISADGNTVAVSGIQDSTNIGAVWVFTRSGGTWSQQGNKIKGVDIAPGFFGSHFGTSLSLSPDGNTLVVGGPDDNIGYGSIWIFQRSGGTWSQLGSKLGGTVSAQAHLGTGVAISADGNTIAAGASYDSGEVGACVIFVRNGNAWSQQGSKLVGSGVQQTYAHQGESVAISADGNTVIIGGWYDNFLIGAAWVFTRDAGVWTQQGDKLVGSTSISTFGYSVSLSADGNTALIGGYGDGNVTNTGAVWIFTRSAGTWSQQGDKKVATGGVGTMRQGWSVSLTASGNTGLVGGPYDNSNTGAAWVYQVAPLTPEITANGPISFCEGQSVTLNAGSYTSYLWSTGETTQTISVSPSSSTNYSVTVTDNIGNTGMGSISITVNPLPQPVLSESSSYICPGDQLNLTAGTYTSYQWSNGAASEVITVNASGSYYVSVTDANGCTGSSPAIVVSLIEAPAPLISANGPTTFCDGNSVTLSATLAGNDLQLNGVDQYLLTPNLKSAFPSTSVTAECWFKANAAGVIMTELDPPVPNAGFHDSQIEILADGHVRVRVWPLASVDLGAVSFGTWHHAVLRYDENSQILDGFLDGIPSAGTESGARIAPSFQYYAFGATDLTNLGSGAYFNGEIDEIRIWNVARSNAEIIADYNAPAALNSSTNPIAYYKLDAASGNIAADVTLNAFNATLVNTSLSGNPSGAPILPSYYEWNDHDADVNLSVDPEFQATYSATYDLYASFPDVCFNVNYSSIAIDVIPPPDANAGSDQLICSSGTPVSIGASGQVGFTYSWSPTDGLNNPSIANPDATPLISTTYTLTVTETATGCSNTDEVSVSFAYGEITSNGTCLGDVLNINTNLNLASLEWKLDGNSYSTVLPTISKVGETVVYNPDELGDAYNLAIDQQGNYYVADLYNWRVEKWEPGATTPVIVAGGNDFGGGADQLTYILGLAVDAGGNVYASDNFNHRVQKWAPGATSGVTVAGGNGYGSNDDQLAYPTDIFVTGDGTLYVADENNYRIQKWAPGATSGVTVAGGNGNGDGMDQFGYVLGLFVDGEGNVYVTDEDNFRVQKWAPGATSGVTVAGGNGEGAASNQLSYPNKIFVDNDGNLYVCDQENNRIQKWAPGATSGVTVAGGFGYGSGPKQLDGPTGVVLQPGNILYVTDGYNGRIQKFAPKVETNFTPLTPGVYNAILTGENGCVIETPSIVINETPAATVGPDHIICPGESASVQLGAAPVNDNTYSWSPSANLNSASVSNPVAMPSSTQYYTLTETIGSTGCVASNSVAVIVDQSPLPAIESENGTCLAGGPVLHLLGASGATQIQWQLNGNMVSTIESMTATDGITVAGGNGPGDADNQFYFPSGVFRDALGNLYITDGVNSRIQKWAPGATSGITVAGGNGEGDGPDQLYYPRTCYVDDSGNIYVADVGNNRIQKWAPGATSGITVAGGNGYGAGANQLSYPNSVKLDAEGNLYINDGDNFRIQKWAPGADTGVTVVGLAGVGDGPDQTNEVTEIFLDGKGNLYIADAGNYRIQKWAPGATSGTTVAGGNGNGDGMDQIGYVLGLFVDANGNIYVSDVDNTRVQKWTVGATSGITAAGGNGPGGNADQFNYQSGIFVDDQSNLYVCDDGNHRIQLFTSSIDTGAYTPMSVGTYTAVITSASGCSLTSNSIQIQNSSSNTSYDVSACDSYELPWGGTVTTSGAYMNTYNEGTGCDSVVTINLTINHGTSSSTDITACDSYEWNGTTYTASGNYTVTGLTNAAGCDSSATLNLTINYSSSSSSDVTACDGYEWNGTTYTASGNYSVTGLTNAAGCDSSATLNLTINYSSSSSSDVTACDSYEWNGITYTASGSYSVTGLTNAAGCDSSATLNLTINHSSSSSIDVAACGSYLWNGITYTASGSYTVTGLTNAAGCDSSATLNLTINNSVAPTSYDVTACDAYELPWGGTVTMSGAYDHTYTNGSGCDSMVTANVTIIHSSTPTSFDITACDSYTLPWGTAVTTGGNYSNTYSNSAGCDSVVTANVTIIAASITPSDPVACEGVEIPLSTITGTGLTYQWYIFGNPIAGATDDTYVVGPNAKKKYRVEVTSDAGCTSYSDQVQVTRLATPNANIKIQNPADNPDLCINGKVKLRGNGASGKSLGYQWSLNGNEIAGATDRDYFATETGSYTLLVTNLSTLCNTLSMPVAVINTCKGNEGSDLQHDLFSIYPNPTDGHFVVQLKLYSPDEGSAMVQVYNALGQAVFDVAVPVSGGELLQEIQLGNKDAAGIYFVRVIFGAQVYQGRIVYQH